MFYNNHNVFAKYDTRCTFPIHQKPKSFDDEEAVLIYRKLVGGTSHLVYAGYDDSWTENGVEYRMSIMVNEYDHKDHRGVEFSLVGELTVETDSSDLLPPPCSLFTDIRKIKVRIPFPHSDDEHTMKDAFRGIYANLLILNQVDPDNLKESK